MVTVSEAVADCDALSVARTVKVLDPAAGRGAGDCSARGERQSRGQGPGGERPGVRRRSAGCRKRLRIGGAYGTAMGSDDVVTVSAGALMVTVSEAVADCEALSVARTVKVLDPAAVGVPRCSAGGECQSRGQGPGGERPGVWRRSAGCRKRLRVGGAYGATRER